MANQSKWNLKSKQKPANHFDCGYCSEPIFDIVNYETKCEQLPICNGCGQNNEVKNEFLMRKDPIKELNKQSVPKKLYNSRKEVLEEIIDEEVSKQYAKPSKFQRIKTASISLGIPAAVGGLVGYLANDVDGAIMGAEYATYTALPWFIYDTICSLTNKQKDKVKRELKSDISDVENDSAAGDVIVSGLGKMVHFLISGLFLHGPPAPIMLGGFALGVYEKIKSYSIAKEISNSADEIFDQNKKNKSNSKFE